MAQELIQKPAWKKWHGKVAGGVAGLAIGGPIGALVGAAAGHAYDHYHRAFVAVEDVLIAVEPERVQPRPVQAQHTAFTIGVIALGAQLAQSDRGLDPQTVDKFRTVFGLPKEQVPVIRRLFEQALFDKVGYRPYAHQLAQVFGMRADKLEELVTGLIRFARADENVTERVVDYLRNIAKIFGIEDARFARMLLAEGIAPAVTRSRDAFAVLGVATNAPEIVVKQVYRDLIREYHPDKLVRYAADAMDMAKANDRMAAINQAYAEVKRQRGWI